MRAQSTQTNRQRRRPRVALAAFAVLVTSAALSQVQQNTTPTPPPPVRRPVPPATNTVPVRPQLPILQRQLPNNGGNAAAPATNATPARNLWNQFAPANNTVPANSRAATPAATQSRAAVPAQNTPATTPARTVPTPAATAQRRPPASTAAAATKTGNNSASGLHVAAVNPTQTVAAARSVPSRTFVGHPGPPGSRETQTRNGNIVRTAADGSVIDVHSPRNGMSIHHGLDGSRRITVERPDHSRVFASSRGVQYVQHPYTFRGRSYDHRTFYVQGKLFHQMYRPYTYAGTTMDVYAPARFYNPDFYQWATSPFNTPARFTWTYTTTPTPWFGYYKGYFTPEPTYARPELWLADFVLASSLSAAYATEPPKNQAPAAATAPAVTPEVKQMLAEEVSRQVKQESVEAKENAQNRDPQPGAGSVVEELGDQKPHVFVVASDLDLVDPSGRRCMISEGDVVQVVSGANSGTSTADAVVLASKGGVECERAARVEIALNDLQEMQNHMRETIDQGMASSEAGKKAQTVTAAFAQSAPPPDANAAREIDQQQQIAAAAES